MPGSHPLHADELLAQGEFTSALAAYEEAVAQQPGDSHAWRGIALTLAKLNRYEEAEAPARKASALQPGQPENRYALGFILGHLGRFREAIAELDVTLDLSPHHLPARQGLVFALVQEGKAQHQAHDFATAEKTLDRAHKLDQTNPDALLALMQLHLHANAKVKAARVWHGAADDLKRHPSLQTVANHMSTDSEMKRHLSQLVTGQSGPTTNPNIQTPTAGVTYVNCPNCQQPIPSFAAICMHCNFRLKAVGQFSARDRGPDVIWQEVALTIVGALWGLNALSLIILGWTDGNEYIRMFSVITGLFGLVVAVGMIIRNDTLLFIAKILAMIQLGGAAWGILISFGLGHPIDVVLNVFRFALACFVIYLCNYSSDV